jgi:hypothetical protein
VYVYVCVCVCIDMTANARRFSHTISPLSLPSSTPLTLRFPLHLSLCLLLICFQIGTSSRAGELASACHC